MALRGEGLPNSASLNFRDGADTATMPVRHRHPFPTTMSSLNKVKDLRLPLGVSRQRSFRIGDNPEGILIPDPGAFRGIMSKMDSNLLPFSTLHSASAVGCWFLRFAAHFGVLPKK